MANKKKPQPQTAPIWRECYDITESGRLFVSSTGEVKFSLVTHQDEKTGRPYVLIDGRPIFLDSLVLSMFGGAERPRRCYDITHLDDNPDNCSSDNLEWTSTQLRNRNQAPVFNTPTNLSYIMQRTITPEMVLSHKYPIVNPVPAAEYTMFDSDLNQDVCSSGSASSLERPSLNSSSTTAELAQRISDLEARLDKRPNDDEERMRHLASLIAEDIIGLNPHIRYISNLSQKEINSKKYLCKLDVPYGYTVVRRKENGRWVWYRVHDHVLQMIEHIFADVRSGKKPKDLLDIRSVKWRPYGKAEFEYLGDYIFNGNEISEDEIGFDMKPDYENDESGRPRDCSEVGNTDKNLEIPDNIRFNMKPSFDSLKDERDSDRRPDNRDLRGYEDVCATSADTESANISPGEENILREAVEGTSKIDIRTDDIPKVDSVGTIDVLDNAASRIEHTEKVRNIDDGLTIEQIDEISEGLKQLTPGDLKNLRYLRGDLVETERGGKGKPVIVTDMRNLREFYCQSIRECAELLGVDRNIVSMAVRGKIRQIGNYQVTLKNNSDGILILLGIYKRYMNMLEQKRAELVDEDEEKKILNEMDDINMEIERMMRERDV